MFLGNRWYYLIQRPWLHIITLLRKCWLIKCRRVLKYDNMACVDLENTHMIANTLNQNVIKHCLYKQTSIQYQFLTAFSLLIFLFIGLSDSKGYVELTKRPYWNSSVKNRLRRRQIHYYYLGHRRPSARWWSV